jgi:hypothetical protein
MPYNDLLNSLGFESDPFAKTNADEEEKLDQYFVAPPFFNAILGDPSAPKSSLVFGPRGGGKTAMKRKIELSSQKHGFLCLTYNQFDIVGRRLSDIDSEYHLRNLVEMLLIGIITAVSDSGINHLSHEDRHFLYLFVKEHLSKIDQTKLKLDINAIKNRSEKAEELWNKFIGPIGLVLNALLERIGLGTAEIKRFQDEGGQLGTLTDQLVTLQAISAKLGYPSVYFLIDRVDENPLTGAAAGETYSFIAPLITDLQLLETPGFAFKFFLWDLLLDDYRRVARPDRIKYYILEWKHDQLAQMLSERLKAYSNGRVSSLQEISDARLPIPLDQAVAICAQESPRNVVRICKEILDQQSEIDSRAKRISEDAVRLGFNRVAENITNELFSDTIIKELQKTHRCDFTIRYIYSDIFKFTQPAALNKVHTWENAGAIRQLGSIQESRGRKPSNHYGIAHILLAKHIFSTIPISEFIRDKTRVCPGCKRVLVRDWDLRSPQQCNFCQNEVR